MNEISVDCHSNNIARSTWSEFQIVEHFVLRITDWNRHSYLLFNWHIKCNIDTNSMLMTLFLTLFLHSISQKSASSFKNKIQKAIKLHIRYLSHVHSICQTTNYTIHILSIQLRIRLFLEAIKTSILLYQITKWTFPWINKKLSTKKIFIARASKTK